MGTTTFRQLAAMTLVAGLVALGFGRAPAAAPPATQDKVADPPARKTQAKGIVPFKMLPTNHMVVRAKLNGKGPFDLIFDLGAPVTLLSDRAGVESGVVKASAPRSFLFNMRGEAEVEKLEVGDLTAEDLPVIVLDHPLLKAINNMFDLKLDGIIGYTFFARYKTTIDYQTKQMTFETVNTRVRNLMKDLQERLAGPRVARQRVLAPAGLWGLELGTPTGGLESSGVPIRSVLADSPAAVAELKAGDILTTIDGRWTTSVDDAYAAAAGVAPGQATPVVVIREGNELTLSVRPAQGF